MILCCGEALIDMIPVTQPDGQTAYIPHTGGAIFNTAIALGRLGAEVGMVSGVSNDAFGVLLADTLTKNHVVTDLLVRSDNLTTLAIVHLKDGQATYAFYDEGSAGRSLKFADFAALPPKISALYFGGISLVNTPAADAYAALLENADTSSIVMIDPNIRPTFVTDEHAYRGRLKRMIAKSDIVKVSDDDLGWLMADGCDVASNAQSLRRMGPQFVIVTVGANGAFAFDTNGSVHVPAVKTEVIDTVGAGDTFNAGFLAKLTERCFSKGDLRQMSADDLLPALELAAKVAAHTVSQSGANPPWRSQL